MQSMVLAVKSVLAQYAGFSGRASRAEFWWWLLAIFLVSIVTQFIDAVVVAPMLGFEPGDEIAGQPLSMLFSLAVVLPTFAAGARRLHDMGRSGWWLLLSLIPLVGSLILLWFYTRPSEGPNAWGAPRPLT